MIARLMKDIHCYATPLKKKTESQGAATSASHHRGTSFLASPAFPIGQFFISIAFIIVFNTLLLLENRFFKLTRALKEQ